MAYRNGAMRANKGAGRKANSVTLGPNGSFPAGDAKHERLAISGATKSYEAGHISKGTEQRIQGRARAMLRRGKSGGRSAGSARTSTSAAQRAKSTSYRKLMGV